MPTKKKTSTKRAPRRAKVSSTHMLVRVAPYNPKRGFVLRRIVVMGHMLRADRGWYKVPKALAEALRKKKQPPSRNYTADEAPNAFDVKTVEEAQQIDESEDAKLSGRAEAPTELGPGRGDLSTRELGTRAKSGGASDAGSASASDAGGASAGE